MKLYKEKKKLVGDVKTAKLLLTLKPNNNKANINAANKGIKPLKKKITYLLLLGDPEVTANLYCNFTHPYWEGCVICSKYLR